VTVLTYINIANAAAQTVKHRIIGIAGRQAICDSFGWCRLSVLLVSRQCRPSPSGIVWRSRQLLRRIPRTDLISAECQKIPAIPA